MPAAGTSEEIPDLTVRDPPGLYRYAGRQLSSAVPLPSLPQSVSPAGPIALRIAPPDIVPRLQPRDAWRHQWLDSQGHPCLQLANATRESHAQPPEQFLLRAPELADFLLDPREGTVRIQCLAKTDVETLEHLLIDQVLPRLLAEQGETILHASCVQVENACALFLGQSGWGKSTLASLLQQCGGQLLSDDCVVLRQEGTQVLAVATYPSLRLFNDSIAHSFDFAPRQSSVARHTGKRRVWVDDPRPTPVTDLVGPAPVTAMYLLNAPSAPIAAVAISPLPAAAACMALVEHRFRLDMGNQRQSVATLRHAAAMAGQIRAFSLGYPRDYSCNLSTTQALRAHLVASGQSST